MLRDLAPLICLLITAGVVYAVRERRRRLYWVRPPFPEATLAQAWEWFPEAFDQHPDRALLPPLPGGDRVSKQVAERLPPIAQAIEGSEHPRAALRSTILEAGARALFLEMLCELPELERPALISGYQPGMEALLSEAAAVSALEFAVLRYYAALRFDDAVAGDWFHRFLWHARPYTREKVRLSREFLLGGDAAAAKLAERYEALIAQLASEALETPPKRRFVPPDFPE